MKLIATFLQHLEEYNIKYVHWKSNTNIDLALKGVDDLDILVDPKQKGKLNIVFKKLHFIRAFSEKDSWQEGIYHYIGLDLESQKLVHIHLHFKLALGYDYDKCFQLPNIKSYLEDTIYYKNRIYLPSYENEFCVLVIRLILKNAFTPFILKLPHQQYKSLKTRKIQGVVEKKGYIEFIDLKKKIDKIKLNQTLQTNFPYLRKEVFNYCLSVLENNNNLFSFFKAGRYLKKDLASYRSYGEFASFRKAFKRIYKIRFYSLLKMIKVFKKFSGKKAGKGGRIIALVGGDGAGKTTTILNLKKLLQKHFAIESIHLGKPRKTFIGIILRTISKSISLFIGLNDFSKAIFYLGIAYDRQSEFLKACQLRDKGYIVLQDRMPLKEITAMDCPRIHLLGKGRFKRLIDLERRIYEKIKGVDLLFVMKLDPEIAIQRRPNDNTSELIIRSGQIWNNEWKAPNTFEIDTGIKDQKQVLDIMLRRVWENLNITFIKTEIIGLNGTGKSTLVKRIKEKKPNTHSSIQVKNHKLVLIKTLISNLMFVLLVWHRTRNKNIALLSIHFKTSLRILKKWEKNKNLPSSNLIFDQGPFFQAAILHKEKCISERQYLNYLNQIQSVIPKIIILNTPTTELYERLRKRKFSGGRGHLMNYEEFLKHCAEYVNSFNLFDKIELSTINVDTYNNSIDEVENIFYRRLSE